MFDVYNAEEYDRTLPPTRPGGVAAAIATLDEESDDEAPEIDPSAMGSQAGTPSTSPRGSFMMVPGAGASFDDDEGSSDFLLPGSPLPGSPRLMRRSSPATSSALAAPPAGASARSSPSASLTPSPRSSYGGIGAHGERPQDLPEPGQKLAKIRLLEERRRSRKRTVSAPHPVLLAATRSLRGSISVDEPSSLQSSLPSNLKHANQVRRTSSMSPSRMGARLSVDVIGGDGTPPAVRIAKESRPKPRRTRSDSMPTVFKLGEGASFADEGGRRDASDVAREGGQPAGARLLSSGPASRVSSSLGSYSRSASEAGHESSEGRGHPARVRPMLSVSDDVITPRVHVAVTAPPEAGAGLGSSSEALPPTLAVGRGEGRERKLLTPMARMSLSVSDADDSDDDSDAGGLQTPLRRAIGQISIEEDSGEEGEAAAKHGGRGHGNATEAGRPEGEAGRAGPPLGWQPDAATAQSPPQQVQQPQRGRASVRSPLASGGATEGAGQQRLGHGAKRASPSRSPSPGKVAAMIPRISLHHAGDATRSAGVGDIALAASVATAATTATAASCHDRPQPKQGPATAALAGGELPAAAAAARKRASQFARDLSVEGRRLSLERSKQRYGKIGGLQSSEEDDPMDSTALPVRGDCV